MHAAAILKTDYPSEWKELHSAIASLGTPLNLARPFTTGRRRPTPKRHMRRLHGRDAYALLPIDQRALNEGMKKALSSWRGQPQASRRTVDGLVDVQIKGDFVKREVFVEVEFGNTASLYRNLFKFHVAGLSQIADVGVMIVAHEHVARLFDDGVTTFETLERLRPYMRAGLSIPTLVIGLDVDDWIGVERQYGEMQRVAEEHELECHDFDLVRGTPPDTELPDGDEG